jgi:hypothetical protein
MKKTIVLIAIAMFFLCIQSAHAYTQVLIDEIMYDAQGADTGHEWIEIENTGDTSINLMLWKFFVGDLKQTNHGIKSYKGSETVSSGAYAVIASNGEKFLADHSGYSGPIFTSSFSLSNKGATIGLKDNSLNIMHQISYGSDVGAAGDGSSLQKIDGAWHVAAPTPGALNTTAVSPIAGPPAAVPAAAIKVSGDLFIGEALIFTFIDGAPAGKLEWNFGDGNTLSADTAAEHLYGFPGTYTIVLSAEGEKIAETTLTIADKPGLKESIDAVGAPVPEKLAETIDAPAEKTMPSEPAVQVEIPLAAAAGRTTIALSDWLVGLAALIVIAVLTVRRFWKPKEQIVIPDDGIELID